MTLVDFLRGQIAESQRMVMRIVAARPRDEVVGDFALWVLLDCQNKAQVVEECAGWLEKPSDDYGAVSVARETIRLLSLSYARHPDYHHEDRV